MVHPDEAVAELAAASGATGAVGVGRGGTDTWWLAGAAVAGAAGGALLLVDPAAPLAAAAAGLLLAAALVRPGRIPPAMAAAVVLEEALVEGVTAALAGAGLAVVAAGALRGTLPIPGAPAPVAAYGAFGLLAVSSLLWTSSPAGTAEELPALGTALAFALVVAFAVRSVGDAASVARTYVAAATATAAWWAGSYALGVDRFENAAGDPNHAALHLLLATPLALALAVHSRSVAGGRALRAAAALCAIGALATLSRGALLAAAVLGVAVFAAPVGLLLRSRGERQRAAVTALGVALLGGAAFGPSLAARFSAPPGSGVTGTRGDLWAAAVRTSADSPLTGIGYGAFRHRSFDLLSQTPGVDLERHLTVALQEGRYVHNLYVEALTELGALGVLVVSALLAATTAQAVLCAARAPKGTSRSLGAALVVATLVLASASLFLSTATSRALALVVGLVTAVGSAAGDPPSRPSGMLHATPPDPPR